jgi:hypothetical protein
VLAAAIDDDEWIALVATERGTFAIDTRGRVPLEGAISASYVGRFGEGRWLICAEGDTGLVATFDSANRVVRPHAGPLRRAASAVAIAGGEAYLGGPHGQLVTARRTLEATRLSVAGEQLPTTAAPTAIAVSPNGAVSIAAGNELFLRETAGSYKVSYRDDTSTAILALAPGRRRMLAFLADGRVVEGRTLAD